MRGTTPRHHGGYIEWADETWWSNEALQAAEARARGANERAEAAERELDWAYNQWGDTIAERDALRARLDALTAWGKRARKCLHQVAGPWDSTDPENVSVAKGMARDMRDAYPAADAPVAGPNIGGTPPTQNPPRPGQFQQGPPFPYQQGNGAPPPRERASAVAPVHGPAEGAPSVGPADSFHAPTFEATINELVVLGRLPEALAFSFSERGYWRERVQARWRARREDQ